MSRWNVQIRQSSHGPGQAYLQMLNIEVEAPTAAEAQSTALANINTQIQEGAVAMVSSNKPGSPAYYRYLGTVGAHNKVLKVTRIRGS